MKIPLMFIILVYISFHNLIVVVASQKSQSQNTNFVKQCCASTSYPKLCYSSLYRYAPEIKTNSRNVATKALTVAFNSAQSTSRIMSRLSKLRTLRPKEASALAGCQMAIGGSMAQLQRSIQGMGHVSAEKQLQVSDVQTWTSTALTYAGSCTESFSGSATNGNVKKIVKRDIQRLTQLTSNALALVNNSYGSRNNGNQP